MGEEVITALVKTGFIGENNRMLTPDITTIKAEMVQVHYKLLSKYGTEFYIIYY